MTDVCFYWVCLSVCVSHREHICPTTSPHSTDFSVYVAHCRGSVLLPRRCDTSCNSGCVDDVTFSHSAPCDDMSPPLRRRELANGPAALYSLRSVIDSERHEMGDKCATQIYLLA